MEPPRVPYEENYTPVLTPVHTQLDCVWGFPTPPCPLGMPPLSTGAPSDGGREGEKMEALVVLASGVCALIGVNISRWGDSDLDRAIREADRASDARRRMGKALGHE